MVDYRGIKAFKDTKSVEQFLEINNYSLNNYLPVLLTSIYHYLNISSLMQLLTITWDIAACITYYTIKTYLSTSHDTI